MADGNNMLIILKIFKVTWSAANSEDRIFDHTYFMIEILIVTYVGC